MSDEITIKYKIGKSKKLKLFGYTFVENNENICKIKVNGEEQEQKLKTHLEINDKIKKDSNDEIEIKLIGINKMTKINDMFIYCDSLITITDIYNWNTSNIIDMNSMFRGCKNLSSLPDISKFNTSNVTNMRGMFYECSSLLSLPDISNWDIHKVNDLSYMFYNCESLTILPDISKWDISNVDNFDFIFYGCKSLFKLPKLSNWTDKNIFFLKSKKIIQNCLSLSFLPFNYKYELPQCINCLHITTKEINIKKNYIDENQGIGINNWNWEELQYNYYFDD